MTPDKDLAARLEELAPKVTDENLTDNGRYFSEFCQNLTSCNHGDTGEFGNKADGKLIELLWNSYRAGQLITHAEADAMVAAERADAERYRYLRERDLDTIADGGVFVGMTPANIVLNLEDLDTWVDAAIRAAATGTKEGE